MARWQEIASRQWGTISRDQLRAAGLSDDAIWRLNKDGMLREILPRVYRLAGAPQNWHQRLMAPCLWGGPTAVASHRSAAVLWGFDGFREGPLEISSPKQKQFPGRFRLYRTEVEAALTTRRLGIPVTNAFRIARADFKLLDAPVIVEAEGRANHSSKLDWEHDLTRRNRITAAGLATVHVTWDMAKNHSDEFLDEVRRVRADQLRRRA